MAADLWVLPTGILSGKNNDSYSSLPRRWRELLILNDLDVIRVIIFHGFLMWQFAYIYLYDTKPKISDLLGRWNKILPWALGNIEGHYNQFFVITYTKWLIEKITD